MRRTSVVVAALLLPAVVLAGSNRVYLVPAVSECPGPSACVPRTFESAYTFDTAILRTPAAKFLPAGKASLAVDVRGVKDPSGALFNGNLTVRVLSGRVSLPTIGTFPDDSPVVQTAPTTLPVKNGRGHVAYEPPAGTPNGLITNGGGAEVFDPTGKRLAVTGSQARP